ncbi:MAG: DUF4174 domain-containing protein [Limnobacter sp.]|nr:DUF4174 domain-containing protein [Limnobacter sp.]
MTTIASRLYFVPVLFLASICVHAMANTSRPLESFDDLLWKNRVVIMFSAEPVSKARALLDNMPAIDERHIAWFVITDEKVISNHLGPVATSFIAQAKSRFKDRPGSVFLVGKDGGTKLKLDTLDLELIFRTIDSMPMRMQEMRP